MDRREILNELQQIVADDRHDLIFSPGKVPGGYKTECV